MDTFIDGSTCDDELYNSPEYQVARSHFDDLDKIVVDYIILEIIEHSLTIIDEFADLLYGIYEDWSRGDRAYDIRKIWVWYWDEDYFYEKCEEWEDFLYEKYERGIIRLKDIDGAGGLAFHLITLGSKEKIKEWLINRYKPSHD